MNVQIREFNRLKLSHYQDDMKAPDSSHHACQTKSSKKINKIAASHQPERLLDDFHPNLLVHVGARRLRRLV